MSTVASKSLPGSDIILVTWSEAWQQQLRCGWNSAQGLGFWNSHPDSSSGQPPHTCYLSFVVSEVGVRATYFTLREHCLGTNL